MTGPISTATDDTAAAAASPVLGVDPGRTSTLPDTAVEAPAPVEVGTADAGEVLPTVGTYIDGEERVHYANPYAKGTVDRLASGEWAEVDVDQPAFTPAGQRVRDVVAYLEDHAGDEDEVARVKAAEAAGEDRPTIANWSPAE